MEIDWSPLRRTLAAFRAEKIALPLWWRDDDAVATTPALEQLNTMSERLQIPVHVAVIPKHATKTLAGYMEEWDNLIPVIHGWAHENHAAIGEKKSEFGTPRQTADAEIAEAVAHMRFLFSTHCVPLFVPPWNRLHTTHLPALRRAGLQGVSTFTPRPSRLAAEGLVQINTHIDPIDWRGTRDLVAPEVLLGHLTRNLEDRRRGEADASEPLGVLTHHLVHSADIWDISEQILSELLEGGAHVQPISPLLEAPE